MMVLNTNINSRGVSNLANLSYGGCLRISSIPGDMNVSFGSRFSFTSFENNSPELKATYNTFSYGLFLRKYTPTRRLGARNEIKFFWSISALFSTSRFSINSPANALIITASSPDRINFKESTNFLVGISPATGLTFQRGRINYWFLEVGGIAPFYKSKLTHNQGIEYYQLQLYFQLGFGVHLIAEGWRPRE